MSEELADLFGESDEDAFDDPKAVGDEGKITKGDAPDSAPLDSAQPAENDISSKKTSGGETKDGEIVDVPPDGVDDDDIEDLFGGSDSGDEAKPASTGLITEPPPDDETRKVVVKRYTPAGKPKQITTTMLPTPPPESEESNKTNLYLVNVPNVIGFEPESFEEDRYLPPSDKTKTNWVRWRIAKDDTVEGGLVKESNTKLVRWSDGSQSLVIGKEVFDCVSHAQANHYVFGSYYLPDTEYDDSGDEGLESDIVKFRLSECHGRLNQRLSVKASIKSSMAAARNINRKHRKAEKTRFLTGDLRMRARREHNIRMLDRQRLRRRQNQLQRSTPMKKMVDLTERDLEEPSDDFSDDFEEAVVNPAALNRAKTELSSEEDSDDQLLGYSRRKRSSMFVDDD